MTKSNDKSGSRLSKTKKANPQQNQQFKTTLSEKLELAKAAETIIAEYEAEQNQLGEMDIHYHYDLSGKLIAETNSTGSLIREYLYLGNQAIAMVIDNNLYYVHNDHLGTPRILTDETQAKVWEVHTTPFGEISEEIGTGIEQLKSFQGQYRDSETGYSQNYFRDYDPSIGRYTTSDPIGLGGGLNTYGYAGGNPIGNVDPLGLCYWDACIVETYIAETVIIGGLAWIANEAISEAVDEFIYDPSNDLNGLQLPALPGLFEGALNLQDIVDDLRNRTDGDSISVPVPPKTKGKYTCIARTQDLNRTEGMCPVYGWGWGIDKDFRTAKNKAIRMANKSINAIDTHHAQWRCVDPKGKILRP